MKSKVVIVKCDSYDQEEVNSAIKRGIEYLGGADCFARQNERILLKPNVLWGTDPSQCVVTHPSVFKAVALLLRESGARLFYGDSPGGIQPAIGALKKAGFHQIAEELGIAQGEFDRGSIVSFPEGISSKILYIAEAVLSSDGVVSLPKLKTHGLTRMTGAVKNQYGCVPGMTKGEYHARFPEIYEFSQLLVDITSFVKARLYVMDAVYAMEGNGPQSGDPKKIGAILLSTDPVAIDSVACRIIDLDPSFVPPLKIGAQCGLGHTLDEQIELIGDPIESFIDKSFRVVRSAPVKVPNTRLLRELKRHFSPRPVIDSKSCTGCRRCEQVCPVNPKAVAVRGKGKVPTFDYRQCIRCFCCHEMCPSRAIHIRTPLLKKIFPFASYLSLFITSIYSKMQKKVNG